MKVKIEITVRYDGSTVNEGLLSDLRRSLDRAIQSDMLSPTGSEYVNEYSASVRGGSMPDNDEDMEARARKLLEDAGMDPDECGLGALDELVFTQSEEDAIDVNSEGTEAQIEYLLGWR